MKSFEDIIDEIIANMDKQRENARIKAFVTDISMMLRENGVIPCMSEVSAEIDDDDALKTVFCCQLEKLDFSEHDKTFEDKIAELENIINHKLGNWDKHGITYQEILDMKAENDLLKQRIAELEKENLQLTESVLRKETKIHELESKEVEKPTKYTTVIVAKEINGQTYVTLDDFMSVVNALQAQIGT